MEEKYDYDDLSLEGWNPMSEEYYNPKVNIYNSGPGSRIPEYLQPANYKKGQNLFELYVGNLSVKHNECAIRNIFSKFGTVVSVIVGRCNTYAIVKYTTYEACDKALMGMNSESEHQLKVEYARKTFQNNSGNQPAQESRMSSSNVIRSCIPKCGNSRCQNRTFDFCTMCKVNFCCAECMVLGYENHRNDCIQIPLHSSQAKHPSMSAKNDTNLDPSRMKETTSISPNQLMEQFHDVRADYNSVRHYPMPAPTNIISSLYDQVEMDREFSKDRHNNRGTIDFPRSTETENSSQSSTDTRSNNNDRLRQKNRDSYRGKDQQYSRESSKSETGNKWNRRDGLGRPKHDYKLTRTKIVSNSEIEVRICELHRNNHPDIMTVSIIDEQASREKMEADLAIETDLKDVGTLKKGEQCVTYDRNNRLIRAIIASTSPLQVRFCDYGSGMYPCKREDLKLLPQKYSHVAYFVYRVKFIDGTSKETLEKLFKDQRSLHIRFLNKENNNIWSVQMTNSKSQNRHTNNEERKDSSNEDVRERGNDAFNVPQEEEKPEKLGEERPAQSRQNSDAKPCDLNVKNERSSRCEVAQQSKIQDDMFSFGLKLDQPIKAFVTFLEDENLFFVADKEELGLLSNLIRKKDMNSLSPLDDICEGKKCLAFFENEWYRASIVCSNPLKVLYIDFGNIERAENKDLKKAPSDLLRVHPLAVKVKLESGTLESEGIESYESFTFLPVKKENDRLWIVKIREKCEVLISAQIADTEYWVHSFPCPEEIARIQFLPSTPLKSSLSVGMICLREFADLKFRAKIISLNPLTVRYIDFNGEEQSDINDLKELPEELQRLPPAGYTVKFKPGVQVTENEVITISRKIEEDLWDVKTK